MTAHRAPGPARLGAALAVQALVLAALVRLAATAPPSLGGNAVALALGVGVAALVYSVWEWSVHHYVYHRVAAPALKPAYLTHHRDHHLRDYPSWRFTGPLPGRGSLQAHDSIWQQVVSRAIGRPVTIPDRWVYLTVGAGALAGTAWRLTHSAPFCAGIVAAGVGFFLLFGKVHGTIHQPGTHPWIEAQPWLPFLARHHYIHHVDLEANQNFLLPLADWCFGTLRVSLTAAEEAAVAARRDAGQAAA